MTGPEHFREAEGIVNQLLTGEIGSSPVGEDLLDRGQLLALAQVHATLANAAATALGSGDDMDERDYKAWYEVAGVKSSGPR